MNLELGFAPVPHLRNTILLTTLLGVLACTPARAQFARLILDSRPGDPVGGGSHFDIIYDGAALPTPTFSPFVNRTLPTGEPTLLSRGLDQNNGTDTDATLAFGTDRLGIPMQPGVYPNAQRAFFAQPGHPGLDIEFRHLGCNTLTGSFTVTDATFGPANEILSFAATFEQHCNGIPPALFGSFTYYAIPEPTTALLAALAVYFLKSRRPIALSK